VRVGGDADGPARAGAPPAPPSPAARQSSNPPAADALPAPRGPGDEAPTAPDAPADAPTAAQSGPAAARTALGALRQRPEPGPVRSPASPPAPAAPPPPPTALVAPATPGGGTERDQTAPAGSLPTRDDLTKAWGDRILTGLSGKAKPRFASGRFVAVEGGAAVFALPNAIHRDRCEEVRADVEAALAAHFGVAVPLRLVVEAVDTVAPDPPPGALDPAEEDFSVDDLGDEAEAAVASPEDRLREAFPGITEVGSSE